MMHDLAELVTAVAILIKVILLVKLILPTSPRRPRGTPTRERVKRMGLDLTDKAMALVGQELRSLPSVVDSADPIGGGDVQHQPDP
jgi:hypothetical protein